MTQKKYKYLVCDYDGTLINDDKVITPKTLKAINDFVGRGGVFVVCTGRMTSGIDHLLQGAGLNCLLASYNGAELIEIQSKKVLYREPIDTKTCIECYKIIEEYGVNGQCYPNNKYVVAKQTPRTDFYAKTMGVEAEYHSPISEYLAQTQSDSSKILINDDSEKLDKIYPVLKSKITSCEVIRSNPEHIDINKKGITKGNACKLIANYYGVTTDDLIGVGDASNDIAMLKAVGFPIAMGNAFENVNSICKFTCPDNNSDGIKYIIDNFCI